MPILSQPAFGPRTALAYVTGGSLLSLWTLVWYFTREAPLTATGWFWLAGLFLTGLTFVILGFLLGPLGRAARQAELPPAEALQAEADIQATAAAHPPPVVAAGAGGAVIPNRQVAPGAGAAMPAAPVVPSAPAGAVPARSV